MDPYTGAVKRHLQGDLTIVPFNVICQRGRHLFRFGDDVYMSPNTRLREKWSFVLLSTFAQVAVRQRDQRHTSRDLRTSPTPTKSRLFPDVSGRARGWFPCQCPASLNDIGVFFSQGRSWWRLFWLGPNIQPIHLPTTTSTTILTILKILCEVMKLVVGTSTNPSEGVLWRSHRSSSSHRPPAFRKYFALNCIRLAN